MTDPTVPVSIPVERRSLLAGLLAGALASAAQSDAAERKHAIFVAANESRFPDHPNTCKLSGKDTQGALSAFASVSPAKGSVPTHIHHKQDEWWHVVEGEYVFQIGDQKHHVKAGDSIFGPRGVPHSFAQVSERAAVVTIFQPAGTMEAFFDELFQFLKDGGTPADPRVPALFRAHGMEIVGPPVSA